jgi:hypothetical protein
VWSPEPAPVERPAGDPPPSTSSQYGDWARQQRPAGTVYGGSPPAHDPAYRPPGQSFPVGFETSGSLTGHILAQGRPDDDDSGRGSKVVIVVMVLVGIFVVAGLAAAIAYFSGVFN